MGAHIKSQIISALGALKGKLEYGQVSSLWSYFGVIFSQWARSVDFGGVSSFTCSDDEVIE